MHYNHKILLSFWGWLGWWWDWVTKSKAIHSPGHRRIHCEGGIGVPEPPRGDRVHVLALPENQRSRGRHQWEEDQTQLTDNAPALIQHSTAIPCLRKSTVQIGYKTHSKTHRMWRIYPKYLKYVSVLLSKLHQNVPIPQSLTNTVHIPYSKFLLYYTRLGLYFEINAL